MLFPDPWQRSRHYPCPVGLQTSRFSSFPKLGVPFLGVPIIRTIVYLGLYWGPPILGNCHLRSRRPGCCASSVAGIQGLRRPWHQRSGLKFVNPRDLLHDSGRAPVGVSRHLGSLSAPAFGYQEVSVQRKSFRLPLLASRRLGEFLSELGN